MLRVLHRLHKALPAGAALVWIAGCAPAAPEYAPIIPVEDIMAGMVVPASDMVFAAVAIVVDKDGIHEIRPQTNDEWGEVGHRARALAETGNLLLFHPEHNANEDWKGFARELIETSMAAAQAADARDADALLRTGGDVYERACLACHAVYLPEE